MPPKRNPNRSKSHNKNNNEAMEVDAMADCVLPRDMMVAILVRLPVKSLYRLKCVCKPWCRLVTNPDFIKVHSSLGPRAYSVQSHLFSCPILGIYPHINRAIAADSDIFLDHCNGLVCVGRPSFTDKIVLWNPATNLWKFLPDSRASFGAVQLISLGFGCNADGDDFKVVRICCLKGKKMKVGVEVYSSKSDSWRIVEVGMKFKVKYPKNHVIVNGNPYWLACFAERVNEVGEIEEAQALLGFDATNMEFMVVALPRVDLLGVGPWPFVNWEGSIAVLDCVMEDDNLLKGIDVWCYDDSEWSRKKRFQLGDSFQVDQILDCSSSGKIVGGCTNGKLFIFDPKTGCVGLSQMKKRTGCSFQIFCYDESLAFLKEMMPTPMRNKEQKPEFNDIGGFFVSSFHHSNGQITCCYALAS